MSSGNNYNDDDDDDDDDDNVIITMHITPNTAIVRKSRFIKHWTKLWGGPARKRLRTPGVDEGAQLS